MTQLFNIQIRARGVSSNPTGDTIKSSEESTIERGRFLSFNVILSNAANEAMKEPQNAFSVVDYLIASKRERWQFLD